MTRIQIITWAGVLLLLSVPAGFLTIITEKPYTPRSEYVLTLIIATFALIVVLGGLCTAIFVLLRKRSQQPLKRAFQVYTFFALAMIALASYKFPEAIKKRDRFEFMRVYEDHLMQVVLNHLESQKTSLPGNAAKHIDMISFCLISEMETNSQLFDALKRSGNYEKFLLNDPRMKIQLKECIEMYKD